MSRNRPLCKAQAPFLLLPARQGWDGREGSWPRRSNAQRQSRVR